MTDVATFAADLRAHQHDWESLGVEGRVYWLRAYARWLLDHEGQLCELLCGDVGKPTVEASIELMYCVDLINYYTGKAGKFLRPTRPRPHNLVNAAKRARVVHRPYPVVAVITPWNFPLGLSLVDAIPALLAGAAVVIKPSPETPNSVLAAVVGWEEIGAPSVLRAVNGGGDVGAALVDAVDYVQFTGSTATGRKIAARCAQRLVPYGLELGGKDAALVLADADLDAAARGIAWGALSNAGQMCTSIERVYVEAAAYPDFVDKLAAHVSTLRPDVDVAPLVTRAQFDIVTGHLSEAVAAGARVLVGGGGDANSHWVQPTVLVDVDHSMSVLCDETFGPVIPVIQVRDEDEAIRCANDSEYGLSASVWTRSPRRGTRVAGRLEAGAVNINDASANLFYFPAPMDGWKASGVGGRFGGAAGVLKYTRPQTVTQPRVRYPYQRHLLWFPYTGRRAAFVRRMLRTLSATGRRRFTWGASGAGDTR